MNTLTDSQVEAISAIERACSVLSLGGCVFTIVTFCLSSSFHKPINRLVFYASFGNMLSNVGTLMSRAYMTDLTSFGCQFQSFLIQLFMPADAFWTLAMAINVYLTFYFKFDAARVRRMEILYLVGCYGIPLIPAFVFLFVKDSQGKRVYGNATLWCWIDSDWDILRIVTFYGPVWVVMFITIFIYIRAGRTIYEKRKQLQDFQPSDLDKCEVLSTVKTTEVTVTREAAGEIGRFPLQDMARRQSNAGPSTGDRQGAYSVHISAGPQAAANFTDLSFLRETDLPVEGGVSTQPVTVAAAQTMPRKRGNNVRRRNHELNNAAWAYTKCAILFFTAILVTWIPSSANRVYSLVHGGQTSTPLEFMSAFVLPLQGFWNAVIYAVTSWKACRELFSGLVSSGPAGVVRLERDVTELTIQPPFRPLRHAHTFKSESTAELAKTKDRSEDASHHC